jgi:hypothetical protein
LTVNSWSNLSDVVYLKFIQNTFLNLAMLITKAEKHLLKTRLYEQ